MHSRLKNLTQIIATVAIGVACFSATVAAATSEAAREEAWRTAIARTPVPAQGCFTADYPLLVWRKIECAAPPKVPYSPTRLPDARPPAGHADDYAAISKGLTSAATGSFPSAKHLVSVTGPYGDNDYSLQLNSNYMQGVPSCAGALDATQCYGWAQFGLSNLFPNAFIQYWLVDYYNTCPAGWTQSPSGPHCFQNSAYVPVPVQDVKDLPNLSVSGTAVANGNDTLIYTIKKKAYSTTAPDSLVSLANGWNETEFNVLGSGGGAEAVFNAGASLTVKTELTDGSNNAPKCSGKKSGGFGAETTNLVLGKCAGFAGKGSALPYIQFTEKAPKN